MDAHAHIQTVSRPWPARATPTVSFLNAPFLRMRHGILLGVAVLGYALLLVAPLMASDRDDRSSSLLSSKAFSALSLITDAPQQVGTLLNRGALRRAHRSKDAQTFARIEKRSPSVQVKKEQQPHPPQDASAQTNVQGLDVRQGAKSMQSVWEKSSSLAFSSQQNPPAKMPPVRPDVQRSSASVGTLTLESTSHSSGPQSTAVPPMAQESREDQSAGSLYRHPQPMLRESFRGASPLGPYGMGRGTVAQKGQSTETGHNPNAHPLSQVSWPKRRFLSMYDDATQDGKTPFSVVNPDAPQGGTLRLARVGPAFEMMNPFVPLALCPPHMLDFVFEPLMKRAYDEPFTLYGHVAEYAQIAPNRSSLILHLNPRARFSDGHLVTTKDVVWTIRQLSRHGTPMRRRSLDQIAAMTVLSPTAIRFDFKVTSDGQWDQEIPLLIAMMNVLSHRSGGADAEAFAIRKDDWLIGSGPYRIAGVRAGRQVIYEKRHDYWAKDAGLVRGLYNPQRIVVDVFAQDDTAFQSFCKGETDIWAEDNVQRWEKGYTLDAVRRGDIRRLAWRHGHPVGMYGVALNTRQPWLSRIGVRQALTIAVGTPLLQPLMGSATARTESFFQNTHFQARLLTADDRILLQSLPAPQTIPLSLSQDAALAMVQRRDQALQRLQAAGMTWRRGIMYTPDGKPFVLRCVVDNRQDAMVAQRLAACFQPLGVHMRIQFMDAARFVSVLTRGDYDLRLYHWRHSLSPGAEQSLYWHTRSAGQAGGRNYAWIQNSNIDALCERLMRLTQYPKVIQTMRLLDHVLRSGFYVIPLYHSDRDCWAFWRHVGTPSFPENGLYWPPIESFWVRP